LLDSKALTKIQSIILIAIIVVAAVGGVAYVLWDGPSQSSDTIKIGVLADLDGLQGKPILQAAQLAVEEINAEGGLLGKKLEVIGEDTDIETEEDTAKINFALTRLLTYHNVDFVLGQVTGEAALMCQELIAEHKKIMIQMGSAIDTLNQRVLDDYDKYKYFFSVSWNTTSLFQGMTNSIVQCREITGFNKIGYLSEDLSWAKGIMDGLDTFLPQNGFDLVYQGKFPLGTMDFSSYFSAAEAAGVEILIPLISLEGGIPFVTEWYDRQSPMLIFGGVLSQASILDSWDWTDGKCDDVITAAFPIMMGYPLTSKTLPAREAYINKWNETPKQFTAHAYDSIRFILADAIKPANTLDTDSLIEALEETSIETTQARNFVFTPSHAVMMKKDFWDSNIDDMLVLLFQWQDGELIPVFPKMLMEEVGASYTFPDWPGPWDNIS